MQQPLSDKRVLISCTEPVLRGALCAAFEAHGAQVQDQREISREHEHDIIVAVSEPHASRLEGLPELVDLPCEALARRGFGRVIQVVYGEPTGANDGALLAHHRLACLRSAVSSVARERAASGVTVNLVELALVAGVNDTGPRSAEVLRRVPLARGVSADEVAAAVVFLAAPAASYITGACLPVTGGHGLGLFPEQLR